MSITTALKARREAIADREAGFTLIELLVVVLIIGILAAIAIPIYLGVQNNAKDSAVKADLVSNKTAIASYGVANNGSVPTTASVNTAATQASVLGKFGWVQSTPNDTGLVYTASTSNPGLYCIVGTSATSTSATTGKFVVTSNTQVATSTTGACPTDQSKW